MEDEKRVLYLINRACFGISSSRMYPSKLAAIHVVLILWYTTRILPTNRRKSGTGGTAAGIRRGGYAGRNIPRYGI